MFIILFKLHEKNKKYKEPESDLDDDAIATHEDNLKAKEIEKAEKKFQKDNEKAAAEGKEQQDESVLKEKIKEIEAAVRDAILTEVTVVRTKYAITIASQYPTRHIQVSLADQTLSTLDSTN